MLSRGIDQNIRTYLYKNIYINVKYRHHLGLLKTVFNPDLSSGTWLRYFQTFTKMYFLIEIQIIIGFDHICGIQDTEKYKYYEFTKYI